MAEVSDIRAPSEVGLGWNQRDTGTINVVMPQQVVGITACILEGDKYAGEFQPLDDVYVYLHQNGQRHQIARIEPGDRIYDWWNDTYASPDERTCESWGASTDDDSSRIIAQVNKHGSWEVDGVGPGEAAWVFVDERSNEIGREPVTLTGGPPVIGDVSLSVSPTVSDRTLSGEVSVGNPVGIGVWVDITVTVTEASTGLQIAQQSFRETVSGTVNIGSTNTTTFDLAETPLPDGVSGDVTVRVEGTAEAIPLEPATRSVSVQEGGTDSDVETSPVGDGGQDTGDSGDETGTDDGSESDDGGQDVRERLLAAIEPLTQPITSRTGLTPEQAALGVVATAGAAAMVVTKNA